MIARLTDIISSLSHSQSLKARVAKGTLWVGCGNGLEQLARLARNMILTRILAPEAFGMMAIVMAVNAAFESFTQVGIKEAVVQNPNGDKSEFINGAWWLSFFRAVSLYVIVFIVSPLAARFYGQPELTGLMRIAFLSLLFNGLMSAQAYVAVKHMKFLKWAVIYHGGGVIGVVTAIGLGFYLQNVWALIIAFTVEGLSRCVLSFSICPYIPRWKFDYSYLSSLFKYARGMIGLPILTFIFMRTDVFVIGRFFSFDNLGLYAMASSMAWLPFSFVTMLISQIMMPVFAKNQNDKLFINDWTINVTAFIAYIGMPAFAFIFLYGDQFLSLIYGEKYGEVATAFSIIFFTALLRTCSVPIASVFLATGVPSYHRKFVAIRAILIISIIYPMIIAFGINGAALSGCLAMIVSLFFQLSSLKSLTGINLTNYFTILIKASLTISIVAGAYFLTKFTLDFSRLNQMYVGLLACLVSYLLTLYFSRDNWKPFISL